MDMLFVGERNSATDPGLGGYGEFTGGHPISSAVRNCC